MEAGKVEAKSTEEGGKQHWGWRSKWIGGVRNHLHAEEGSKTEEIWMSSRYLFLKSGWMVIPFAEVTNKAREEVGGWIGWR